MTLSSQREARTTYRVVIVDKYLSASLYMWEMNLGAVHYTGMYIHALLNLPSEAEVKLDG